MENSVESLYFATAVSGVASIVISLGVWSTRHLEVRKSITFTTILYLSLFFFIWTPFLWCVSLDLFQGQWRVYGFLYGVGGSAFGVDFGQYVYVIEYLMLMFLAVCLGGGIGRRRPRLEFPRIERRMMLDLKQREMALRSISKWVEICAILFALAFILAIGPNRIIFSDRNRFDLSVNPVVLNILTLGTFLSAIIAILSATFTARWVSLITCSVITGIPFLVLASRAFTIILILGVVSGGWLIRRRSRPIAWILSPFYVALVVVALELPLKMRDIGDTGLTVAAQEVGGIFDGIRNDPRKEFALVVQNATVGFPLLVEAKTSADNNINIDAGIPWQYFLLSFSPLPSMLDGFRSNYFEYSHTVNGYSPYSMWAELYAVSGVLPLGVLFLWSLATVRLGELRCGNWWFDVPLQILLVCGSAGFMIFAEQYLTRQATRYFFYSSELVVVLYWIGRRKMRNRPGCGVMRTAITGREGDSEKRSNGVV